MKRSRPSDVLTLFPSAAAVPCAAHRYHWPTPPYSEMHHDIPQAWQRFWAPPGTRDGALWAKDTTPLCPTGHRNVHVWIVRLMRAGTTDEPAEALEAVRAQFGRRARGGEFGIAFSGLVRFAAAGGSLVELRAARQFGQA